MTIDIGCMAWLVQIRYLAGRSLSAKACLPTCRLCCRFEAQACKAHHLLLTPPDSPMTAGVRLHHHALQAGVVASPQTGQ